MIQLLPGNGRGEVGTEGPRAELRSVAEQRPPSPSRLEKAHSAFRALGRGSFCTSQGFSRLS